MKLPLSKRLEKHYSIGKAAEILGMSRDTLRPHLNSGKVKGIKTPGGQWRIPESELLKLTGQDTEQENACVIYARVSSQKQKKAGNLDRQVERLQEYAQTQGWPIKAVIKEVGGGLNETRKGLTRVFKLARARQMTKVLIEFPDRLARSGRHYIIEHLALNNVEVVIKDESDNHLKQDKDLNQELVDDLIAIIYSFSGKLYGRRSAKFRKLKKCVQQTMKEETS